MFSLPRSTRQLAYVRLLMQVHCDLSAMVRNGRGYECTHGLAALSGLAGRRPHEVEARGLHIDYPDNLVGSYSAGLLDATKRLDYTIVHGSAVLPDEVST